MIDPTSLDGKQQTRGLDPPGGEDYIPSYDICSSVRACDHNSLNHTAAFAEVEIDDLTIQAKPNALRSLDSFSMN
jgi:hypothetical protein